MKRECIYSDTCEKHPPPPRRVNGGRRGKTSTSARGDLRAIGITQDITVTLTTGCKLVSALRMHEANEKGYRVHSFWIHLLHVSTKQKQHRPGFRQGIGALPLLSMPWKLESCCIRLMYTAIYTRSKCNGSDAGVNLFLNQLGKVFTLINLKFHFELNGHRLN